MSVPRARQVNARKVVKTVGVYEKPAQAGPRIPRPSLYVAVAALAAGLGAAAFYWL